MVLDDEGCLTPPQPYVSVQYGDDEAEGPVGRTLESEPVDVL